MTKFADRGTGHATALGRHLLGDFWGVDPTRVNDVHAVSEWVRAAITASGATLIELRWHHFSPQGLTLFALLKESHLAVHTWPEKGYVAIDIFTCGQTNPQAAMEILKTKLEPEFVTIREVARGEM